MTINKMLEVLKMGSKNGSALRELAKYYGCDDYDLSPISDEMTDKWISKQKCDCYEQGNWFLGNSYGTCMGTKDREPCTCKGDRNKCNFYGKENVL